jgi:hypothetical protein
MVELVMAVIRTRADVLNTLKMKSMLWNKGIEISGIILKKEEANDGIPQEFLEDMTRLKILGFLD